MGVKWTNEQKKVIDLRNRNILVSAAAGSGKTAVLVERIIQRITDRENPVDVNRLLVVTYTDAAAAEMKERIGAAIEKKREEYPGDTYLERQSSLLHNAMITTVHSFCLSVIREHFHVIGIDPGFRIAEDGELKLLKKDVMDEMLEECYEDGKKEFLDFVDRFSSGKNDRKIEEIILRLYEYSRSYPQPEKWLEQCAGAYDGEKIRPFACRRIKEEMKGIRDILRAALHIAEEPDGPYMYADMLESDLRETDHLVQTDDFEEMFERYGKIKWKRLSSKKDDTVSENKREQVKELRKKGKDLFGELGRTYFYLSPERWQEDMKAARPSVCMLTELVNRFAALLDERKRRRGMIDFGDMEQFALKILTEEKEGRLVPSETASEYQDQFEEVMIDEYQDSNLVQETILTSVSRQSRGQYNIFMVGDVKQSIYSFRLSRPELFMEKYNTYSLADSSRQRIDLHKNFRSRPEVLEGVNFIFRQIMRRELGGIEYDDSAALYPGAEFPPLPEEKQDGNAAELLLFDKEYTGIEDERKAEAYVIAQRIRKLMEEGAVTDRETGTFRKVRFSDIVILARSIKGWAEVLTNVLMEEGIPAYSVSREGYFETYEVSVLLDYLKILGNSRQDLPLAAVLTSPFCGLNTVELAEIRAAFPDGTFYEAVSLYAENKQDPVSIRLRRCLEQIREFRECMSYTPIHDLLVNIMERTGYGLYITAMPGGAQRLANLEMLVEKAASFESTSYKGLFNFVRYIEQLKKYDVDYGEAGIMDEQSDTVRIMSIHKSKGLEFPIVFLTGAGRRFHSQDTKAGILLHPELGAGIDLIDLDRRTKTPTFLKNVIRRELAAENLAEEMRILYVGMTRAKEKLIMTAGVNDMEDYLNPDGKVILYPAGARSYLDWIYPCLISPETGDFREKMPITIRTADMQMLENADAQMQADDLALDTMRHWNTETVYAPGFRKRLDDQMNYRYPYATEKSMKMKFTVSELKKMAGTEEEQGEAMYPEQVQMPMIPKFLSGEHSLTGASRGSAYHKLLELLDFTKTYDEETLKHRILELRQEGKLSAEMADCIEPGDITEFLHCESGIRMSRAAEAEKLFKEQPFVLGVPASEIYTGNVPGEIILVQGIIDVYFEEPDGIVVLDYKTDRVRTAKDLRDKYHAQLDYYAEAVSRLRGKPVKEKIIYSFTLKEEIRI